MKNTEHVRLRLWTHAFHFFISPSAGMIMSLRDRFPQAHRYGYVNIIKRVCEWDHLKSNIEWYFPPRISAKVKKLLFLKRFIRHRVINRSITVLLLQNSSIMKLIHFQRWATLHCHYSAHSVQVLLTSDSANAVISMMILNMNCL